MNMATGELILKRPHRRLEHWLGRGSILRRVIRRRVNAVALAWLLLVIFVAIFAPLVTLHDPIKPDFLGTHNGISKEHWLGQDQLGRDILSRVIYGARASIQVGFIAVGIGMALGIPLGLLAGFRGGTTDEVIMRLMDAIIVLPGIMLAMAISAALGPSLTNVMIAIGVTGTPRDARLLRGQVLQVREQDYVTAAYSVGVPGFWIAVRHIFPNSIQPLIVAGTLAVGFAILTEAGLSFLGVGIQPPTPSWGSMLRDGYAYLELNIIESAAPGLAIFFTVLAVNLLGDGLREALDPRLRGA